MTHAKDRTPPPEPGQAKYVPAGTGPMYQGPGDRVTFLVTSEESRGACSIIEANIAPAGGPPPHIHHFEDESVYVLSGLLTLHQDGRTIQARPGDLLHVPQGVAHSIRNEGTQEVRALLIVSPSRPAGIQRFFEETFSLATDRSAPPPLATEELMERMMAAAARNGCEFVQPS